MCIISTKAWGHKNQEMACGCDAYMATLASRSVFGQLGGGTWRNGRGVYVSTEKMTKNRLQGSQKRGEALLVQIATDSGHFGSLRSASA